MVTIQLPLDLIKRVDRQVARNGCSRGELIAAALSIGLRDEERHEDVVDALENIDEAMIQGDRN
ncbi:MAG: ribbon-helix-helix protein, CopG family [Porphyrobacter sp.]|nr:ribbon-helix-helix protein, CopG family [Porphyrobacter sp.]